MTAKLSEGSDLERLRQLRRQKAWRAIIELSQHLLADSTINQTPSLYVELGKAYLQVRQYDAARKALCKAQKLQPGYTVAIRRFAELEAALGNYEAAIEHWHALKRKKGKRADSSIFLNLAKAYRNICQLPVAKRYARAGIARFPANRQLQKELRHIEWMLQDQCSPNDTPPFAADNIGHHPYRNLDARNHWKKTVANRNPLNIEHWYRRKFSISGLSISSAGSCFAQHIGRELRENGFEYIDVEPPPDFLRAEGHHDYGYGIYSARFGNIYTSRQLLQLVQQSLYLFRPRDSVWTKGNGYVDAFRPTIEPDPFARVDDVIEARESHLAAVQRMFKISNVFIYTMGLTETWMSKEDGAVYPVAPGVSGGCYDSTRYTFKNLTYPEVLKDMEEFVKLVRQLNSHLKIILTVSPVPLMATASPDNVVVASSYSKSVLRAVAGYLSKSYDFIDYFPSYEIVGSHVMRGAFFNPDGRTVSSYGVSHVMEQFFLEHVPSSKQLHEYPKTADPDEVVCDEELYSEFGPS